jgi:hypothetical protein
MDSTVACAVFTMYYANDGDICYAPMAVPQEQRTIDAHYTALHSPSRGFFASHAHTHYSNNSTRTARNNGYKSAH